MITALALSHSDLVLRGIETALDGQPDIALEIGQNVNPWRCADPPEVLLAHTPATPDPYLPPSLALLARRTRVLLLCDRLQPDLLAIALERLAGYLLTSDPLSACLPRAIRQAACGARFVTSDSVRAGLAELPVRPPSSQLSPDQLRTLRLYAAGHDPTTIGLLRGRSPASVYAALHRIRRKLDARTTLQAVYIAHQRNLLVDPEVSL